MRDRQMRFDINCIAEDGELVNVEMSLNPKKFEPVRLEYHAAKLFAGQESISISRCPALFGVFGGLKRPLIGLAFVLFRGINENKERIVGFLEL